MFLTDLKKIEAYNNIVRVNLITTDLFSELFTMDKARYLSLTALSSDRNFACNPRKVKILFSHLATISFIT